MKVVFVPASQNIKKSVNPYEKMGIIKIPKDNKGYQLLYKLGWDGVSQLGPNKNKKFFKDPVIGKKRPRKYKRVCIFKF
tara:strand:- start:4177 stop:4413 length:237 start_codon:yes stop_codon:yes gene_type:complete